MNVVYLFTIISQSLPLLHTHSAKHLSAQYNARHILVYVAVLPCTNHTCMSSNAKGLTDSALTTCPTATTHSTRHTTNTTTFTSSPDLSTPVTDISTQSTPLSFSSSSFSMTTNDGVTAESATHNSSSQPGSML